MLGISSVLQLFLLWIAQLFTLHFIDLKFVLGGARFHCSGFEVMCVDVCAQKLVQTVLSSHDVCGRVWMCVPRRLYRQSCRHMDLLLSVSFQVNGDIPPRLKKSAHEIILDFIRSRPPLNPVCDLTPPHGWHTCGNMFPPQPVPQNTAPGGLLTLSFSLWLWSLTVNTMPHSFRVHCCPVLKGTDTSPWLQETHTAASSFAVAMVLCSWGSFWRPWIRVFWSGLSVGLCFLCSPLTSPGSTASTHQGLSNPLYVQ